MIIDVQVFLAKRQKQDKAFTLKFILKLHLFFYKALIVIIFKK